MIEFPAFRATRMCGVLSEGPTWDAARERLLWVDIQAGLVHEGVLECDGSITAVQRFEFSGTVGAVAVSTAEALAVAAADTVLIIDPEGDRREFSRILPPRSGRRINDASTDPAGRLYLGTLSLEQPSESEVLVRIEDDGEVTVIDDDLTLSNGIAWSPSGDRMYSVDSLRRTIYVREYDPATGRTGRREVFIDGLTGIPDGICADRDGGLWVAVWGAGQVRRYDRDGGQDAVIDVPVPHVSSVGFAGTDLGTLVITTAQQDLTAAELQRFPASGALFTASVDVPGVPIAPWRGSIYQEGNECDSSASATRGTSAPPHSSPTARTSTSPTSRPISMRRSSGRAVSRRSAGSSPNAMRADI
ncbi:SMP-30/gluconolactonase/LRE family protein [Nocardia xishanensis]|uniref:SMP-30/gluconolactonase/LRE family protein n=1 Tax=Nocardia xishanensis TaxID=238964 RepID=A0ABW7XB91_9NOCA